MPRRIAILALATLFLAGASHAIDREDDLARRAINAAARLAGRNLALYEPSRSPKERAASTVAVNGHVMLEAYRSGGGLSFLHAARQAGDSLIAHADMNGDGQTGWGRYWKSDLGDGGNTAFDTGCALELNRAYDDELYDIARIAHFLIALAATTEEERYLATARAAIDATWEDGEATLGGAGFAYFKTEGACDKGWQVKNINMLMAVPIALLARATGEAKYEERARQMLAAERAEIEAGNLGYHARETAKERAGAPGKYIERAQIEKDGGIVCNPETGAGDSCAYHLGLEARSLALAGLALGEPKETWRGDVMKIMSGLEARDADLCLGEVNAKGRAPNLTACAAYYCVFRYFEPRFDERCLTRTAAPAPLSQDTLLGIFWSARLFQDG
jgi:hypothetical protein